MGMTKPGMYRHVTWRGILRGAGTVIAALAFWACAYVFTVFLLSLGGAS